MKTLLLDDVHELHWKMLKSVCLIASLLPAKHVADVLWHVSHAESQIVLGFFALSLFASCASLGFIGALIILTLSVNDIKHPFEQRIIRIYQHLPMLFLAGVVTYLVMNFQY